MSVGSSLSALPIDVIGTVRDYLSLEERKNLGQANRAFEKNVRGLRLADNYQQEKGMSGSVFFQQPYRLIRDAGGNGRGFCYALSPHGRKLASGLVDGTLQVWDLSTGKCSETISTNSDWVHSCAFAPDDDTLVFGTGPHITLWNVKTGARLKSFVGHAETVSFCVFSRDGQVLASGSRDGLIKLWDVRTGGCLNTLNGHAQAITSCAFSPDGRMLASVAEEDRLNLWDMQTGACKTTFVAGALSCAFSPDGNLLAVGSNRGEVLLWAVGTEDSPHTFAAGKDEILHCAFSLDGKRLALGSRYGITIWDVKNGKCLQELGGSAPDAGGERVCFSADGRTLASVCSGGTVHLWVSRAWKVWKLYEHADAPCWPYFKPFEMFAGFSIEKMFLFAQLQDKQSLLIALAAIYLSWHLKWWCEHNPKLRTLERHIRENIKYLDGFGDKAPLEAYLQDVKAQITKISEMWPSGGKEVEDILSNALNKSGMRVAPSLYDRCRSQCLEILVVHGLFFLFIRTMLA